MARLSKLEKILVGAATTVAAGGLLLRILGVRAARASVQPDPPGPDPDVLPPMTPTAPSVDAAHSATSLSDAGLRFIAAHEGYRKDPYNDSAGNCTIGYGHLIHYGSCTGSEPAVLRQGLSRDAALTLLGTDAAERVEAVHDAVKVPLSQPQFDALVSFVYNVGAGNFRRSTLLKRLNASVYQAVPSEMMRWVYAGGVKLRGLVNRRRDEGRLFSTEDYGF